MGDYVVYGEVDICRVVKIGVPEIRPGADRPHYFLETQFYKGMIYAPTDTRVPMRPVISREEALSLISGMPAIECEISLSSDRKKLAEHYDALLAPHTCAALARTAKSIYEKYHGGSARGKAPNSTESAYYKKASELLLQELSVAPGEPVERVQRRIEERLSPGEAMRWSL